jgi:general secretion pathway protein D
MGINLRATDRPFNEVIERIATLANLRYSVAGNSMRIEKDAPYIKNYSLDFLNIVRSSTSSYTLSTSVLSGGGSSGGGGGSAGGSGGSSGGSSGGTAGTVGTSGSTSGINTQAESDLWTALDKSVDEILAYKSAGADEASGPSVSGAGGGGSGGAGAASGFVVNRQAGILSVTATEKQHEMIQRFLTMMSRNSSAQVLIEAKIVEVSLTDQFLSGVNWNKVLGDINKTYLQPGKYAPSLNDFTAPSNPFAVGIKSGDLDAVITATQHFGTTHTLSSPRLAAINNQQAVLTFATNEVFFDCTYTAPSTTSSSTGVSTSGTTTSSNAPTYNCTHSSVPIGIILSILPSINLDTQEITLNVRPTLTRKTSDKISPTSAFLRATATGPAAAAALIPDTTVPVIQVREIDSITKVKSGGVMVIGGLMEDSSNNDETGVPGASELPIFGNLFKSRSEDSKKTELIIFIKATIVNSDGSSHEIDRAIYNKFVTDPRPLFPKQ